MGQLTMHMTLAGGERSRRLARTILVAVAVTVGGLATPAIAIGAPNDSWDIDAFDWCLEATDPENPLDWSINDIKTQNRFCCEKSGGVFQDDGYTGRCVAPPAKEQSARPGLPPLPTRKPLPVQVIGPLPGDVPMEVAPRSG
ncbi:hypothetical protein ABGB19_13695 [Mycobacterium sp. B14F4]|uniref:hypothetical protein n=1 Tax=Mycobacterium sp. B14F4 TaxID=3153565 RepID=UPI00325C6275